jgi:hypothetical protein
MESNKNIHKIAFIFSKISLCLLMIFLIVHFYVLLFTNIITTIDVMLIFTSFFASYYSLKYLKYTNSPNKKQIFLAYVISIFFIVTIFS